MSVLVAYGIFRRISQSKNLTKSERIKTLDELSAAAKEYADKLREGAEKKTSMDNKQAAKAIRKAADKWEKHYAKSWGPKSKRPDADMVETGKNDASDLRHIAALLEKGSTKYGFQSAIKMADDLDTIIRDQIPINVWDWMNSKHYPT